MDKILSILKAVLQFIPFIKKLFPEQTSKLPDPIVMTESVWDKKNSK